MIRKGTKVIITRRVTLEDYKKIWPDLKNLWSPDFIYDTNRPYRVIKTTSKTVVLDNAAEIPKFLVERVK